jgi:hypothetical protein
MFKKLAKSRLVDFSVGGFRNLRRAAPCRAEFLNQTPANDNLPGLRRPKGRRRIPTPALACHWIDHNGRLECRWQAETSRDAPVADAEGCPDGTSSAKAIGSSRAGFGSGHATFLHRSPRRNLQTSALTVGA